MTVSYRFIGKGTTDANGVAHITEDANGDTVSPPGYVGVGAGEIDVVASVDKPISSGSVVSQPSTVWDTLFYDSGIDGTHNNKWLEHSCTVTPSSDGTTVVGSNYYVASEHTTSDWTKRVAFPSSFNVEFDVVSYTGTQYLRILDTSDTTCGQVTIDATGHYKVCVTSTGITCTVDGETHYIYNSSNTASGRVGFSGANLKYKDFKVYSA